MATRKVNYLPFIKRQAFPINPSLTGPIRVSTTLWNMAPGGARRAHLHDLIVQQGTDIANGRQFTALGGALWMRMGISGKGYFTENLYDHRGFQNGPLAMNAVWDWSRGGRFPYRLHRGQQMRVVVGASPNGSATRSVLFNGVRAETDGEAILLYATDVLGGPVPGGAQFNLNLRSMRLNNPGQGDVDLYSVTLPEWEQWIPTGGAAPLNTYSPHFEVYDGNDRAFWEGTDWRHMIDPKTATILLGDEWECTPSEVPVFEFESFDTAADAVIVIVRGVLEVDDAMGMEVG